MAVPAAVGVSLFRWHRSVLRVKAAKLDRKHS